MIGVASLVVASMRGIGTLRKIAAGVRKFKDVAQSLDELRNVVQVARQEITTLGSTHEKELDTAIATVKAELSAEKDAEKRDILCSQLTSLCLTKAELAKTCNCLHNDVLFVSIEAECEEILQDCATTPTSTPETFDKLAPNVQETFPHEGLRRFGCYYLSLCRWAEELIGTGLGTERIIQLYNALVKEGWIRDDSIIDMRKNAAEMRHTAFILDPVAVLNRLQQAVQFLMVKHSDTRGQGPTAIEVVRSGGLSHFVLWLGDQKWDSLGGNAASYVPVNWRVIV